MATYDVDVEGVTYEVDAPDETTAWKWANATHRQSAPAKEGGGLLQGIGNLAAGAVRGAGSIGATILSPFDAAGITGMTNEQRRAAMDAGLQELGAQPESLAYKGGKLGAEIAGTAGVGGAIAKGAQVAKYAPKFAEALRTGGFNLGGAPATTAGQMAGNAVQRIGAGASVGGASAGMVDPSSTGEGAAIGAAFPVVAKAAAGLGSATKAALYDPLMNKDKLMAAALMRAVGRENAPDVIQAMGTKARTPGVNLSAGEASQNEALAAMEDALRSANAGGALSKTAQENRTAMANALRNIAQDDAAVTAAQNVRSAASGKLYDQAPAEFAAAQITPELSARMAELSSRPAISSAMQEAATLAKNSGVPLDNTTALGGLHYAKRALDDQISTAMRNGRSEEVKALMQSKNDLMGYLEEVAPSYREGSRVFAEMSRPINQMEVGQYLANKFIPATSGEAPASLNAAMLARALRDPDAAAQTATGFSGAKMANIMSPDQMNTITGVSSDANMIAEAMRRGAGYSSPTARRLSTGGYIGENFAEKAPLLSKLFEGIGQVPGINYATKGASAIGGMVGKGINNQIAMRLDEMLARDPAGVSAMLQRELSAMPAQERDVVLRMIPKGALTTSAAVMSAQ